MTVLHTLRYTGLICFIYINWKYKCMTWENLSVLSYGWLHSSLENGVFDDLRSPFQTLLPVACVLYGRKWRSDDAQGVFHHPPQHNCSTFSCTFSYLVTVTVPFLQFLPPCSSLCQLWKLWERWCFPPVCPWGYFTTHLRHIRLLDTRRGSRSVKQGI